MKMCSMCSVWSNCYDDESEIYEFLKIKRIFDSECEFEMCEKKIRMRIFYLK